MELYYIVVNDIQYLIDYSLEFLNSNNDVVLSSIKLGRFFNSSCTFLEKAYAEKICNLLFKYYDIVGVPRKVG